MGGADRRPGGHGRARLRGRRCRARWSPRLASRVPSVLSDAHYVDTRIGCRASREVGVDRRLGPRRAGAGQRRRCGSAMRSEVFARSRRLASGSMSLNLMIRRVVPSTSKLTFNPLARRVLDAFDVIPNLLYREFRELPPNHLRIRVGVGNRIFANQVHHLQAGRTGGSAGSRPDGSRWTATSSTSAWGAVATPGTWRRFATTTGRTRAATWASTSMPRRSVVPGALRRPVRVRAVDPPQQLLRQRPGLVFAVPHPS